MASVIILVFYSDGLSLVTMESPFFSGCLSERRGSRCRGFNCELDRPAPSLQSF